MAAAGVPQSVSRDKDQGITPERGSEGACPLQKKQRPGGSQRSPPTEGGYKKDSYKKDSYKKGG
jgi:hypothetical protein